MALASELAPSTLSSPTAINSPHSVPVICNARLPRFEQIKRFHVLDRPLSLEAGELTPSLKVRRQEVLRLYAAQIAALYQEEGPRASTS